MDHVNLMWIASVAHAHYWPHDIILTIQSITVIYCQYVKHAIEFVNDKLAMLAIHWIMRNIFYGTVIVHVNLTV